MGHFQTLAYLNAVRMDHVFPHSRKGLKSLLTRIILGIYCHLSHWITEAIKMVIFVGFMKKNCLTMKKIKNNLL
jgi:hypothetical protein